MSAPPLAAVAPSFEHDVDAFDATLRRPRLAAVDALRGLTIVGMLLVDAPGDARFTFAQLRHSAWNGCTLADLIFPVFLFLVGITTHLSLRAHAARGTSDRIVRRRIVRRAALLVLLGVLLNWFPFYQFGTLDGYDAPRAIDRVLYRLQELRLPGVLQRIGVAYLAAALLVRHATTRRVLWTIVALLAGYWLLMTLVPVPGEHTVGAALLDAPTRTLAAWLDRLAFDWSRWGLGNHLWVDTAAYDPEGVLSTLPAIASVLIGVVAGRALDGASSLGSRVPALFAAGAALAAAGLAWGLVFPINKPIWTSSYVLFSAGVACAALAASALVAESRRGAPFARIALVFGTNPIVAYVGAALLAVLLDSTIRIRVGGHRRSAHELILGALHAIPWSDRVASLAYSLVFIAICYAGLRVLHRRGVLLRI